MSIDVVDVSKVESVSGVPEYELGSEVKRGGCTYRYVRTAGALDRGKGYILDRDSTAGSAISSSNQTSAPIALGFPQVAFAAPTSPATYSYGWVAVSGKFQIEVPGNCSANVELLSTSVGGILHSTGSKRVDGIKITTAASVASAMNNAFAPTYVTLPTDA
jgi:hypothetical protein